MSDDIHALSGAYAVDALDDIERAQFERHLAGCETCREEVDSLLEASALLAETTMLAPPGALRERVLAEIATVRPLPPLRPAAAAPTTTSTTTSTATSTGRRSRVRRFPALVAAAAAVVAVGVGTTAVVQPWDDGTSEAPRLSAVDRVKAAEDVQVFRHQFPDGAEAVLYRSASLNQAVVVTRDMGPAPDGKVYQAWLQHDETMVSAGLMPEGPDNVVQLQGQPATADGFGITVEPAGGSVVPSKNPIVLVDFDQA